jgi:hypothetical protein
LLVVEFLSSSSPQIEALKDAPSMQSSVSEMLKIFAAAKCDPFEASYKEENPWRVDPTESGCCG